MRQPGFPCLLRLVSTIYREMIYLSVRSEGRSLSREELARKVKLDALSYAAYSLLIALVTAVLSAAPFFTGWLALEDAIRASGLIYATSMVAFTFILCASSAWMAQEYRLFEPLMALPLERRQVRLLSALVAAVDVMPMALVPLAYGILLALLLRSALAGLIGAIYGYTSMLLAMGIAMASSALVSKRVSGASVRARLARALSTMAFTACLAMALLMSQLVEVLAPSAVGLTELPPLLQMSYPFSVGESVIWALGAGPRGLVASTSLALAYLLLSAVAFELGLSRFWSAMTAPSPRLGELVKPRLRAPPALSMDPPIGVLLKDLKTIYRDPRTSHSLIAPAVAHVALFVIILRIGGLSAHIVGLTHGLLGVLMGIAAYQLMASEGPMFWLLFANGLSRRDLALGKALTCTLTYAAYVLPLGLALTCALSAPQYAIYASAGCLLGLASSAVCARYLAELVDPGDKVLKLGVLDEFFIAVVLLTLATPYCLLVLVAGPLVVLLVALAEALTALVIAAW